MDLYRTPKGTWAGTIKDVRAATKAEGSKAGSWRKVKVPTKKASLIDFLNSQHSAAQEAQERTKAPRPTRRPKRGRNGYRYRVYGGPTQPLFVGAVRAADAKGAIKAITETLEARLVTAH